MVYIFIIHSLSIFKLIHTWNESHKTCIEEAFEHFLLIVIGEDNNMKSQLVTGLFQFH